MTDILEQNRHYLCHCGIETDLIFNKGLDLPGFALFPLLEEESGRDVLRDYAHHQIATARDNGMGAILESATWMANAERAGPLGYDAAALDRINRSAITLLRDAAEGADTPVLISANIGPRGDAYAPEQQTGQEDARNYHAPQIASVAAAGADMVSGFTLAYVSEAAGIALAARDAGVPSVISFTVETDGALPDGTPLVQAIKACDTATDRAPAYYMINCAHPDHFGPVLDAAIATGRLKGLVANASRCSHAELDEAEELDDGDPRELGGQLTGLARRFPPLQVLGGCCGTDARHLQEIARHLNAT